MKFKCPDCGSEQTLTNAIFETCIFCGYCSVSHLTQVKALVKRINRFIRYTAELEEQQYKWAGIINRLANLYIDGALSTNELDYANEMIEKVSPYLGLTEE